MKLTRSLESFAEKVNHLYFITQMTEKSSTTMCAIPKDKAWAEIVCRSCLKLEKKNAVNCANSALIDIRRQLCRVLLVTKWSVELLWSKESHPAFVELFPVFLDLF